VLRLADVGSTGGWEGGPRPASRSAYSSTCDSRAPNVSDLVVTGHAASQFTYADGAAAVITGAKVFRTEAMLEAAWRRDVATFDVACNRKVLEDQVRNVRIVSLKPLAFPRTGSHTRAFRARGEYTGGGAGITDLIMFAHGRTICLVVTFSVVHSPQTASLLRDFDRELTSLLAARIAAA
jgi:hypothetical protein